MNYFTKFFSAGKQKLYFGVTVTMVFLFTGLGTTAQETYDASIQSPAEVYVQDLTVSKEVYRSGETVSGSFTLFNNREQAVSDLYYEVALVGNFQKNTLAGTFYDSVKFGPYYLTGRESKKINFKYTLPKAIAGDGLGIEVTAILSSGFSMGWQDVKFKVNGEMSFLNLTQAFVSIGSEEFKAQIGPIVYESEKAFIEATLQNPTQSVVEVKPQIKIYNRASVDVIQTLQTSFVKVPPNGTVSIKYELPKFDNHSGVYVGNVEFFGANNIKKASGFEFRYIIAGDIATITGLTLDKINVEKGDNIKVDLSYSGSVFDVRGYTKKSNAVYDLNIKIFSKSNKLIVDYNDTLDFDQGTKKSFNLTALDSGSNIRAEATVKKGEVILAKYKSGPLAGGNGGEFGITTYFGLIGIIILIIILIVFFIFLFPKIKNKKLFSILIFVILFSLLPLYPAKAFVVTESSSSTAGGDVPYNLSASINTPVGSPCYVPGNPTSGHFYLAGSATATNCGNEALYLEYYYKREGGSDWHFGGSTVNSTLWNSENTPVERSGQFSMGSFNVETTPGTHKIWLKVKAYAYWSGNIRTEQWTQLSGYQTYCVASPPPTVTCTASPATTLLGHTVMWSANATGGNGTFTYNWSGDVSGNTSIVANHYDTNPGTRRATVTATSNGVSGTSPECSMRVLSPDELSATCFASSTSAIAGVTDVTWTAVPSGGAGDYHYTWSGTDGLPTTDTISVVKKYASTATNPKTAQVTVTTQASAITESFCDGIDNNANGMIDEGCYSCQANDFFVVGSRAYCFDFRRASNVTEATAICQQNGKYLASYVDGETESDILKIISKYDSVRARQPVYSDTVGFTVNKGLDIADSCGAITSIFSASNGNLFYDFGGSGINCTQENGMLHDGSDGSVAYGRLNDGGAGGAVCESSSLGIPDTANTVTVYCDDSVIVSWPAVTVSSCTGTPASAQVGEPIVWAVPAANVTGGNGTYTYSWSGSNGLLGTGASLPPKTYSTGGKKIANVVVTSNGVSTMTSCYAYVRGSPKAELLNVSSGYCDVGAATGSVFFGWTYVSR